MKKPIDIDLDSIEERNDGTVIIEEGSSKVTKDGIIDEDGDPRDRLPDHAVQNADGSVTLPLASPVSVTTRKDGKIRERNYADLTFHRLNGADMRAVSATSEEMQSVMTFARSTRIPVTVMSAIYDQMDMADIADGGRILNHFFTRGRKTPR